MAKLEQTVHTTLRAALDSDSPPDWAAHLDLETRRLLSDVPLKETLSNDLVVILSDPRLGIGANEFDLNNPIDFARYYLQVARAVQIVRNDQADTPRQIAGDVTAYMKARPSNIELRARYIKLSPLDLSPVLHALATHQRPSDAQIGAAPRLTEMSERACRPAAANGRAYSLYLVIATPAEEIGRSTYKVDELGSYGGSSEVRYRRIMEQHDPRKARDYTSWALKNPDLDVPSSPQSKSSVPGLKRLYLFMAGDPRDPPTPASFSIAARATPHDLSSPSLYDSGFNFVSPAPTDPFPSQPNAVYLEGGRDYQTKGEMRFFEAILNTITWSARESRRLISMSKRYGPRILELWAQSATVSLGVGSGHEKFGSMGGWNAVPGQQAERGRRSWALRQARGTSSFSPTARKKGGANSAAQTIHGRLADLLNSKLPFRLTPCGTSGSALETKLLGAWTLAVRKEGNFPQSDKLPALSPDGYHGVVGLALSDEDYRFFAYTFAFFDDTVEDVVVSNTENCHHDLSSKGFSRARDLAMCAAHFSGRTERLPASVKPSVGPVRTYTLDTAYRSPSIPAGSGASRNKGGILLNYEGGSVDPAYDDWTAPGRAPTAKQRKRKAEAEEAGSESAAHRARKQKNKTDSWLSPSTPVGLSLGISPDPSSPSLGVQKSTHRRAIAAPELPPPSSSPSSPAVSPALKPYFPASLPAPGPAATYFDSPASWPPFDPYADLSAVATAPYFDSPAPLLPFNPYADLSAAATAPYFNSPASWPPFDPDVNLSATATAPYFDSLPGPSKSQGAKEGS